MYVVKKMNPQVPEGTTAKSVHHPVFRHFPCWNGNVPEGFIVNFLGVMTRVEYFDSYSGISDQYPMDRNVETELPPFDEEYLEWVDILEAILAAEDHFTMLELGAGYGRWTVNAAAALKQHRNLPFTFVAVEAEPVHFQWMVQHLADNSVDPSNTRLIQAAVAAVDGTVGFHMGQSQWGGPKQWYGQYIGGSHPVDALALNTLLQPLGTVDLIDIDVQGAELDVLQAAAQALDEKVKKIHIGTHSPDIEAGLLSLFGRLGWECIHSFPLGSSATTEWGIISFQDGVQTWLNPTYSDQSRTRAAVLSDKLVASRREGARLWQELEKMRQEKQNARMLESSSLAWRLLARGGQLRDRIAPVGTRRRKMIEFITKKI